MALALAAGARAQSAGVLPDGPIPAAGAPVVRAAEIRRDEVETAPGKADPGKEGAIARASFEERKWSRYVDPGEQVPRLTAREKMMFWAHDEVRWYAPVPEFLSAGYGQLTGANPKYGSDSAAFGERLGAGFIRDATMRFLCDSVVPTLTEEDPRYYRKATGNYGIRALWAAESALVTRRSEGGYVPNNSDLWGHLGASLLTQAYYPQRSIHPGVVVSTWLTSIAGTAGNNEFFEFWPDAVNAWRRHRARVRARASMNALGNASGNASGKKRHSSDEERSGARE